MSLTEEKRTEKAQLETELSEKRRGLEEVKNQFPQSFEQLKIKEDSVGRLKFEAEDLEKKIRAIDEEIQAMGVEGMEEKRKSIVQKAQSLAEEKRKLLTRLSEIDMEGQKLREQFEETTPKKLIQTESSQMLKWERTLKENRITGFTMRGEPVVGEKPPCREETTSDAMPFRIDAMREAGWTLCPGQEIREEPLTPANSRLSPTIPTPEVFDAFT